MTDTQTAFVLVPREPKKLFTYGRTFNAIAAATRLNAVGIGISVKAFIEAFGPLPDATPKPPESEIGPVLWVSPGQFAAHRDPLDPDHTGGNYLPVRVTMDGKFTQPLYPQARIDADAAIIAALRAEVERLRNCEWINAK